MTVRVDDALVEALVREGRHVEAARICADAGLPARAAELLAAVWKYAEAIAIASDAGLYDEAYKHALAAGERESTLALIASLSARPDQASRAASYAEARGRTGDAARLREAAGEIELAAALHERAGELADAARCWSELGDARRAGVLYEKRLREAPDDAASALALGQILVRGGRWEHAARALQIAAADRALAIPAGRLLIACFDALGMDDAAQERLDTMRRADPALPATVPEMLEHAFGSARAPRADGEALLAGRYRIVRALGSGGTGRVLLAEDAFYGREVAIKVLHAGGSGSAGRDALARFAREARVAAGIDHPNVVRVFEYHADGPFLVMEHMPGGTLEDRLGREGEGPSPLSPAIVRHLMRSVLAALEAVHRRGVVHRDLKPANVFFGPTGEVKLGDFGVAHLVDLGTTMTGAMVGTLAYMTPEQITGASRPDASTDLYALGVILYRCLVGVLPLPGPDFVAQHLETVPEPASARAPWLDARFDALLARLLAKAPADRPRTATEVLETIDLLPWDAAEEGAGAGAPIVRPRSEPPPPASSATTATTGEAVPDRYRALVTRADGAVVADDELLRRRVLIVHCTPARTDALRRCARADSPFLQAVWAIDTASARAILELPEGARPSAGAIAPPALLELGEALDALHRAGIAHGAVDRDHIVLGPGRAVLLLPELAGGSAEDDLRALASLASAPS